MNQRSDGTSSRSSSQLPFGPKSLAIGAGALIVYGLSRRSKAGTALATAGGVLAYSAIKSASSPSQAETHANFLVNASPEQAYQLWRNFENLSRFMVHIKSVRVLDNERSEWLALGPMQREIRWTAELTDDVPNRRIAWRSLPDSDIDTSGSVEFRADPQGRGTYVYATVEYSVPGGAFTTGLASIFGKHPEFMVREDVRRFKALLETGEVPTTAGQTHGPRGLHGHTEQVLFRETSNHPAPQADPAFQRTA